MYHHTHYITMRLVIDNLDIQPAIAFRWSHCEWRESHDRNGETREKG
jgi:hypothetical protein